MFFSVYRLKFCLILSLIYIEQINIADKDEVFDFLTTAFEHEEGLFYKEEDFYLE